MNGAKGRLGSANIRTFMVPTLVEILGPDTVSRWQKAAPARVAEGDILRASGSHLIAIYLYGYAVEMTLKAAYFRTILRFGPNVEIDADMRNRVESRARQSRLMTGAPHDIAGWARLLVVHRELVLKHPFRADFGLRLVSRAERLYDVFWRPRMRYRGTIATAVQSGESRTIVEWFMNNREKM